MKTVSLELGKQKPKYAGIAQEGYKASAKAQEKKKRLDKIEDMILSGCPREVAVKSTGISLRTYSNHKKAFRERGIVGLEERSKRPHNVRKPSWLDTQAYKDVLAYRKAHPTDGREVIHLTLLHQGKMPFSVSTVGRMLKYAKDRKEIISARRAANRGADKRRRSFKGHVQRWRRGMRSKEAGAMVQIDHMSVHRDGRVLKHFSAVCPSTKLVVSQVCGTASSHKAALFLQKVQESMPELKSVQVDGGSEFRGEFEEAAQDLGLKVYVLPARTPQLNGVVERFNRTLRDAFYSGYGGPWNVGGVSQALEGYIRHYNEERCHTALGVPPYIYAQSLRLAA